MSVAYTSFTYTRPRGLGLGELLGEAINLVSVVVSVVLVVVGAAVIVVVGFADGLAVVVGVFTVAIIIIIVVLILAANPVVNVGVRVLSNSASSCCSR